ncbi:aspartyl protease family protein [Ichthyenterobacterium sp. W332]|uniref:Aspartyl protease family protein n=1 Tax=Microcosmobacter mediterraneus TaxID=3075607 RepID=A0ABU2YJF5_9FLAO|nr:aspartyl protease family protein [Ichthyenterobacterium sp. W332]MDT0558305.1 aspartyl protease family protein [Ichthyenterobacterium sp. W332]
MKKSLVVINLIFLILCLGSSYGQSRFNLPNGKSDKIRFKLAGNLIILPVEINGVELSFILDSGVSKPILFNFMNTDSLQIKDVEKIYLRGLGSGGMIEALKSKSNLVKLGNAVGVNQDIYVIFDSDINFTPRLGVQVHGIIGYDIFKDHVVEINYNSKYLRLYDPDHYTYKDCKKKCRSFALSFDNRKPFIDAQVTIDDEAIPVKLLLDTGSSDALWLFEDHELNIKPLNGIFFKDFLGKGLSGNVYGKRSKVNAFRLSNFILEDVNVAFPDSVSISYARKFKARNGSIGGELLKRFNIIFDYPNQKIVLKRNSNFNKPFYYNKSGIVLEQVGYRMVREQVNKVSYDSYGRKNDESTSVKVSDFYRYVLKPAFTIVDLREDSPAAESGLLINDIIISVNGKPTQNMSLEEANGFFTDRTGKQVRVTVEREEKERLSFKFKLEDVFKEKALKN